MSEILKTITAETSYEAQQIAKETYGDNFDIINTETVKDSILFGWGKKEKIKLTIRLKPDSSNTLNNSSTASNNLNNKKEDDNLSINKLSTPSHIAQKVYNKMATPHMRTKVDGLHGIQENGEEPKSIKNQSKEYTVLAGNFLSALEEFKNQRNKENKIVGEYRMNESTSKKLEEIQSQLDKLTATLSKLAKESNNFLVENKLPQGLCDVEKELQEIETPQEIIKEISQFLRINCGKEILNESKASFHELRNLMKKSLIISPDYEIKKDSKPQIIVLMGPTGVGKTTTIAKIAAQYSFNPLKPIRMSFFNIDFYKLGAKEQLQKYADIFNIILEDITTLKDLDECLIKHNNDDLIIVDTAGRSQYAYEDLDELKLYLNRIPNSTKYLTMSSTSKYSDLKEIVSSFERIGFDHIILTKTDETKTLGPAVGILMKSKKSLAYITNGQQVPEDYRKADFSFFEEKIFNTNQSNNFNNGLMDLL